MLVGTTVLGTLTVLWPTMLRTKMEPEATRWTTRGLPVIVVGAGPGGSATAALCAQRGLDVLGRQIGPGEAAVHLQRAHRADHDRGVGGEDRARHAADDAVG